MLMKLTAGVNFTNILCVAFMCLDPKSAKRLDCLIANLGSACVKAARKATRNILKASVMLVKLTTLCTNFLANNCHGWHIQ